MNKHSVIISKNTKETSTWKKLLIAHAHHSIELSGCYCGGKVFDETLKLLKERLEKAPHLCVRILSVKDLVTSSNRKNLRKLQALFPQRFHYLLTSRKVAFFPKLKIMENHVKVLIVDEKYFIIGGSNLSDACNLTIRESAEKRKFSLLDWVMGAGMCDMDAIASGPLAETIRQKFYTLWTKWQNFQTGSASVKYTPLDDTERRAAIPLFDQNTRDIDHDVPMECVTSGPEDGGDNACVQTLTHFFNRAQNTIVMGNMVFNEKSLIAYLQKASERKVQISLITNGNKQGESSIGKRILTTANRSNYSLLSPQHTEIYEYGIRGYVYHKKVTVIDGKITLIGSMNISSKSVSCDDEILLVIYSKAVAKRVLSILSEDIKYSEKIAQKDMKYFSKGWKRLLSSLASSFNQHKFN